MFVDKDNNDFISIALKTITLPTDRPYILKLAKLKQTTANILSNKKYLWEIGISTNFNSPKNRAIKKHTKEFLHKHFLYNKTHITKLLNQETTVVIFLLDRTTYLNGPVTQDMIASAICFKTSTQLDCCIIDYLCM